MTGGDDADTGVFECLACGTCCIAPDISSLGKGVGVRCTYLDGSGRCSIYATRPQVCRDYRPDEICLRIDAPTSSERVSNYLRLFSLD